MKLEDIIAAGVGLPINPNMRSVAAGLRESRARLRMDRPHRLAHYLSQTAHESARFRHDKEIWGPTPAQQRYDIRTDLGNTPQRDGDGKAFMGRTALQATGRFNYRAFTRWAAENYPHLNPPNFEADPDAMLTDPWEGLFPAYYWERHGLNRYADENDIEMVTKRINGGLNGYADRLALYTRYGLVLLGYGPTSVREFQARTGGLQIDGIAGPRTRQAIHRQLVGMDDLDFSQDGAVRPVGPPPVSVRPRPTPPVGGALGAFLQWLIEALNRR